MKLDRKNLYEQVLREVAYCLAQLDNFPEGWSVDGVNCRISGLFAVCRNFLPQLVGSLTLYNGIYLTQSVLDEVKTNKYWPQWYNPFKGV